MSGTRLDDCLREGVISGTGGEATVDCRARGRGADECAGARVRCLMEGTGGVRKVRFVVGGRGKSGGVRVVYYFHNEAMPVYLLTVFAKNEKANLSAERACAARHRAQAGVQEVRT